MTSPKAHHQINDKLVANEDALARQIVHNGYGEITGF
jgi:hypothetical protein